MASLCNKNTKTGAQQAFRMCLPKAGEGPADVSMALVAARPKFI